MGFETEGFAEARRDYGSSFSVVAAVWLSI